MHEIFIPLRRVGLVLLSTFVLTLACVYRDGSTLEKSTRSRRVRTRLACGVGHHDAECFINVVLVLALAIFLFILLLFWIEIHKPLSYERQ